MAVAGVLLGAISLAIMTFADGLLLWVVARTALGFGGGLLLPGMRRAATVLDPEHAGENLGRLIVGEVIGFTIGPVIAAVLVQIGGIRLPFAVMAVGLFAFVPFVARLPDDEGRTTDHVEHSFDLLSLRRLQGALILVFGYFLLLGAFEAVVPLMIQDRGGGALETGIALTIFGVPIALVSTHAGRTADRVGGAKVAMVGMTVSAAVTVTYGFLPGIWPLVAVMLIAALADGYGFTAGQVAVSRAVTEQRQAGALGLMGAAEVLGAGLAALPAAALYGEFGSRTTWLAASAVSLVCLAIGGLRIRSTEPVTPTPPPVERHPPAPAV
jgi:predicted MFS family arabinose efflux permease